MSIDNLLRDAGIGSSAQRAKIIAAMSASGGRDSEVEGKLRKALGAAGIDSKFHDRAIDEIEAAGLFPRGSTLDTMSASTMTTFAARIEAAAADPAKSTAVRYALGMCRRLNVDLHAAADPYQLDRELNRAGVPVDRRIELKTALARGGLID